MAASTFGGPGRRAAAYALLLGCVFGSLSACSGESASPAGASTVGATSPTSSESAGPTGSTAPTGSAEPTGTAASATAPTSSSAAPAPDAVLKISVQGRTVTPTPGRRTLSVGDQVRLIVTSNTANTLHVHGVEIEKHLDPGVPLTVDFTVKDPGVYAVELHEPELLLVQLVVR